MKFFQLFYSMSCVTFTRDSSCLQAGFIRPIQKSNSLNEKIMIYIEKLVIKECGDRSIRRRSIRRRSIRCRSIRRTLNSSPLNSSLLNSSRSIRRCSIRRVQFVARSIRRTLNSSPLNSSHTQFVAAQFVAYIACK